MKNNDKFKRLINIDKIIKNAYGKLKTYLFYEDKENIKLVCKFILSLKKIENSILNSMTDDELCYAVDLVDILFTMSTVDDETIRASKLILNLYDYRHENDEEDISYNFTDYGVYDNAYYYNAMCYTKNVIVHDELGIKKSNEKFYNTLKKTYYEMLTKYAYENYNMENYLLESEMALVYQNEGFFEYSFLDVCKNIVLEGSDIKENEDAVHIITTLENNYIFKSIISSLNDDELDDLLTFIKDIKTKHNGKMLNYYENIVVNILNDLAR